MQLVASLDRPDASLNNEDVAYEQAAQKVIDWRKAHGEMSQITFAQRAKVSVGCLQGFETATRATREKNLVKIAAAIGMTKAELLSGDPAPEKPDPLLKDLIPEDLRVANRYHHAGAEAKRAVKVFLSAAVSDDLRERIALCLDLLMRFKDDMLPAVEDLLTAWDADVRAEEVSEMPPTKAAPAGRAETPDKKKSS